MSVSVRRSGNLLPVLLVVPLSACTSPDARMQAPPIVRLVSHETPAPARAVETAQTSLTPAVNESAQSNIDLSESTHTLRGANLRVADLICIAYRTPDRPLALIPFMTTARVISDAPLPAGRYDVSIYVPHGGAAHLRTALKQALQKTFGIRAQRDRHEMAVLVLSAPGPSTASDSGRPEPPQAPDTTRITLTGSDFSLLAEQLEERLRTAVVDETRLSEPYRLYLDAPLSSTEGYVLSPEIVQAALREQLGLDLTPGRRSIEVLVVETR
jgi:uncharacterized protein (TIGR03435 family)